MLWQKQLVWIFYNIKPSSHQLWFFRFSTQKTQLSEFVVWGLSLLVYVVLFDTVGAYFETVFKKKRVNSHIHDSQSADHTLLESWISLMYPDTECVQFIYYVDKIKEVQFHGHKYMFMHTHIMPTLLCKLTLSYNEGVCMKAVRVTLWSHQRMRKLSRVSKAWLLRTSTQYNFWKFPLTWAF